MGWLTNKHDPSPLLREDKRGKGLGLPGAGRVLRALLRLLAPQAWDWLVDQ